MWWWWWRGASRLSLLRPFILLLLHFTSLVLSLHPSDPPKSPRPSLYPVGHPLAYAPGAIHKLQQDARGGADGNAFLDFYDSFHDVGESWEEDEGWWDGVEEVVLTNSFADGFYDLYDDQDYDLNYTCADALPCEDLATWSPPPDSILSLPPPPVPPFLRSAIGRLQEEGKKLRAEREEEEQQKQLEEEGDAGEKEERWSQDECSLCEWATGGNNTIDLLPPIQEPGVGGSMVGILVGVALVSAAVGAAVMIVLLRCRKFRILPSSTDSCPGLLRGTWTKGPPNNTSVGENIGSGNAKGLTENSEGTVSTGAATTHTGWAMKLWRRGSSQERPLRPTSSQGSENSYTEEPYVNADTESAVYAELNSAGGPGHPGYGRYSLNTYSEVPDPLPATLHAYMSHGTYENAGYVLSETQDSSASTSTPSSAYYSDLSSASVNNNNNNKRKKKRRKSADGGELRGKGPASICSNVAALNQHNLGGFHPYHPPQLLPLALELLPQHLGEHPLLSPTLTAVHPQPIQTPISNLPTHHTNLPPHHPSLQPQQSSLPPQHTNLPPQHTNLPPQHTNLPPSLSLANTLSGLPAPYTLVTPTFSSSMPAHNTTLTSLPTHHAFSSTLASHPGLLVTVNQPLTTPISLHTAQHHTLPTSIKSSLPCTISGSYTQPALSGPHSLPTTDILSAPNVADEGPVVPSDLTGHVPFPEMGEGEEEESEGTEGDTHRPLPPLPSRQQQGPQRRRAYLSPSKQDQSLPPVPSEYV